MYTLRPKDMRALEIPFNMIRPARPEGKRVWTL